MPIGVMTFRGKQSIAPNFRVRPFAWNHGDCHGILLVRNPIIQQSEHTSILRRTNRSAAPAGGCDGAAPLSFVPAQREM